MTVDSRNITVQVEEGAWMMPFTPCHLHQRLLAEYEKTRPVAVDA